MVTKGVLECGSKRICMQSCVPLMTAGWVDVDTDVLEGAVMAVWEVYTCASPSLYKCEVEYKLYKS